MRRLLPLFAVAALVAAGPTAASPSWLAAPSAADARPRAYFSGTDRQVADAWFARHSGVVPKAYDPTGKLPERIDRGLAPLDRVPSNAPMVRLPWGLERELAPIPQGLERVILGRHLLLLDPQTRTILDIMREIVR